MICECLRVIRGTLIRAFRDPWDFRVIRGLPGFCVIHGPWDLRVIRVGGGLRSPS